MVQKVLGPGRSSPLEGTPERLWAGKISPMRGFWLLAAALIGGVLVWQGRPWLEQRAAPAVEAVPRAITPAGDLAADEKATIELFERSKGSVVFITTTQLVRDFWSRNLFSVPRGAGSGFVWDNDGHVITNNHVVQGAAEAKVRLNDGRDYGARLVGASPAHLDEHKIGDTIKLTVQRDGKPTELTATLKAGA